MKLKSIFSSYLEYRKCGVHESVEIHPVANALSPLDLQTVALLVCLLVIAELSAEQNHPKYTETTT